MIISIKELTFDTIIGLLDFERVTKQKIIINCHINYSFKNESSFINYADVTQLIETIMNREKFKLIETALIVLIDEIKKTFSLSERITLTITKPDIINNCHVSVSHEKSFL